MAQRTRRQFVVGSTVLALSALAGCNGYGGGGGGMEPTGTATPTETATGTATQTGTETETETPGQASPGQRVTTYLNASPEAGNFDGTIADETGSDTVVVKVGAQGNGGNFAFAPPAVKITSGTTISWEWTGEGGDHNVDSHADSDFEFRSGSPTSSGTFEKTFDNPGVGLYFCSPHQSFGMKGGFIVA